MINSVVTVTGRNATVAGFTLVPAGSVAKYDIGVNVAIAGNASAEIGHNYIRGGRIGVNLGCASSGSTVYHNNVRGATETGINIDTCEIPPAYPGSTFNSVHHNTVCGGLFPYSIAGGQGSDFNSVHHNTARWITFSATGTLCITTPPSFQYRPRQPRQRNLEQYNSRCLSINGAVDAAGTTTETGVQLSTTSATDQSARRWQRTVTRRRSGSQLAIALAPALPQPRLTR